MASIPSEELEYRIHLLPLPRKVVSLGHRREEYRVMDVVWEVHDNFTGRLSGEKIEWDAATKWDKEAEAWLPVPDYYSVMMTLAKNAAEGYVRELREHHRLYVY